MNSFHLLGRVLQTLAVTSQGPEGDSLRKALVSQHHYLLALLRYKTGDESLAEDLLQETYLAFLALAPDPRRFADLTKLKNYLVTIALNKLRDHWRREGGSKGRRTLFRSRKELDEWLENLPSAHAGPARELQEKEEEDRRNRAVALAMEKLPDRHRIVLGLKFTEDLDNGGIAARMGIGVKAVESLLVRAKAGFRKEFENVALRENGSPGERVDRGRDEPDDPR